MKHRILIIEDDTVIQEQLRNLLAGNGYEAEAINDFPVTMEQVGAFQPHLILIDIKLPGIDGFSVCSQIRAFSNMPIIFVTSCNTDMDELNSIMLGGDAFITKPYNTAILLAKIASLLKRAYPAAEQLKERYLLPEVMEKPERTDDQVYYRLLKLAGKSMLEQVNEVRRERTEYKEYVEQWVHEIKTPITAMRLLCENNPSQVTKELLAQIEKVNRYTEQSLYYARSEHTEKDYSVREIRLFDAVHRSIAENKYLLLQNGVGINLEETEDTVYSDEKWLCFILNQLIVNAVKYRTGQPIVKFYTKRQGNQVILCVQDNGIGIDASDLPRIFEKGFTGQNGRKALQNSTGIGLYLCKRLCDKLGIGICADSKGSGTILQLIFHINDFIQEVQD